jgi:four helix bundle protein
MDNNTAKLMGRQFAAKVVQLYKHLCNNKKETVLSECLLRAGTGIGANLAKIDCALNKNDYFQKIYSALLDCAETKYWLELLYETDFLTEFEFNNAIKECEEIRKMISIAIKNLRSPAAKSDSSSEQGS